MRRVCEGEAKSLRRVSEGMTSFLSPWGEAEGSPVEILRYRSEWQNKKLRRTSFLSPFFTCYTFSCHTFFICSFFYQSPFLTFYSFLSVTLFYLLHFFLPHIFYLFFFYQSPFFYLLLFFYLSPFFTCYTFLHVTFFLLVTLRRSRRVSCGDSSLSLTRKSIRFFTPLTLRSEWRLFRHPEGFSPKGLLRGFFTFGSELQKGVQTTLSWAEAKEWENKKLRRCPEPKPWAYAKNLRRNDSNDKIVQNIIFYQQFQDWMV